MPYNIKIYEFQNFSDVSFFTFDYKEISNNKD